MKKYKIENIGEIKQGEKDGEVWKTLDVVLVETEGEYPNSFVANMYKKGEYVKNIESFSASNPIGSVVEAELKFKAREYQGRFFQNVSLWSIKKVEDTEPVQEDVAPEDIPF